MGWVGLEWKSKKAGANKWKEPKGEEKKLQMQQQKEERNPERGDREKIGQIWGINNSTGEATKWGLSCHISRVISFGIEIMHGYIKLISEETPSFPQTYTGILFDLQEFNTPVFFRYICFWL